jgi:hypothetical protein
MGDILVHLTDIHVGVIYYIMHFFVYNSQCNSGQMKSYHHGTKHHTPTSRCGTWIEHHWNLESFPDPWIGEMLTMVEQILQFFWDYPTMASWRIFKTSTLKISSSSKHYLKASVLDAYCTYFLVSIYKNTYSYFYQKCWESYYHIFTYIILVTGIWVEY